MESEQRKRGVLKARIVRTGALGPRYALGKILFLGCLGKVIYLVNDI